MFMFLQKLNLKALLEYWKCIRNIEQMRTHGILLDVIDTCSLSVSYF